MTQVDAVDPDKEKLDELYPGLMRIGDPFEMKTGPMHGVGRCIRRRLTPRGGVMFTIHFEDGRIKDWEWFD